MNILNKIWWLIKEYGLCLYVGYFVGTNYDITTWTYWGILVGFIVMLTIFELHIAQKTVAKMSDQFLTEVKKRLATLDEEDPDTKSDTSRLNTAKS